MKSPPQQQGGAAVEINILMRGERGKCSRMTYQVTEYVNDSLSRMHWDRSPVKKNEEPVRMQCQY